MHLSVLALAVTAVVVAICALVLLRYGWIESWCVTAEENLEAGTVTFEKKKEGSGAVDAKRTNVAASSSQFSTPEMARGDSGDLMVSSSLQSSAVMKSHGGVSVQWSPDSSWCPPPSPPILKPYLARPTVRFRRRSDGSTFTITGEKKM